MDLSGKDPLLEFSGLPNGATNKFKSSILDLSLLKFSVWGKLLKTHFQGSVTVT